MKGLEHTIHSASSKLAAFCALPLARTTVPPLRHLVSFRVIEPGGEQMLDNAFQAWLDRRGDNQVKTQWPEIHLYELQNVWCTGDQGLLFFDEGGLFNACSTIERLPVKAVRRPLRPLARRIQSPVFHLTGFSHENHGHFLLHHLPRLIACRELLNSIPDLRILVAPGHSRWQSRYLDALGISPDRVIEGSHGTLRLDRVFYVPWMAGSFKLVNPLILRTMGSQFRRGAACDGGAPALFVSRQDAPDKRLANEAEIIAATQEILGCDVQAVQLSKLGMREQISLFNKARLVIGPLGQGLTNVIYCANPRLITLDPFCGESMNSAAQMFSMLAAVCGGQGGIFHAGSSYEGPDRSWTFPLETYSEKLRRVSNHWWPDQASH